MRQAALLLVVFILAAVLFRAHLTAAGRWFYDTFGFVGAFVGVLVSDSCAVPITFDVYLVAAVAANEPVWPVLLAVCLGSIAGGSAAYCIGSRLHEWRWLRARIAGLRGEELFARWGIAAVAIGAWTPLPFSVTCWCAGMFKMDFGRFFLTTLHRIPRALVTYLLLRLGWMALQT